MRVSDYPMPKKTRRKKSAPRPPAEALLPPRIDRQPAPRNLMIGMKVNAEEKAAVEDLARRLGYPNVAEFVRDAINQIVARGAKR